MIKKIVLTGAGCSGKSSILKLLVTESSGKLIALPEIVNVLGNSDLPFPLARDIVNNHKREYISLIVNLQSELEQFISMAYANTKQALLIDRGILDTIAYHPDPLVWFHENKSSLQVELSRYDLVIQLGVDKGVYETDARVRPYSFENAKTHEDLLQKYYRYHANYHFVQACPRFDDKVAAVRRLIAVAGSSQLRAAV